MIITNPSEWIWQQKILTREQAKLNTNNMNNNNSGAIYRNKKEKESQPDYTGNAQLDGKTYRLAGWLNKSKSGNTYLRLLFTEQAPADLNPTAVQTSANMPPISNNTEMVDDLPF